jgi:hypothetical protein
MTAQCLRLGQLAAAGSDSDQLGCRLLPSTSGGDVVHFLILTTQQVQIHLDKFQIKKCVS